MGTIVRCAFGGNRFNVSNAQLAARALFKKTLLFVALQLAEHTEADGSISMKVAELRKLTGYAVGCLNNALRKIVESRLLQRDPTYPWVFTWDRERIVELAKPAPRKRKQMAPPAFAPELEHWQFVWVEAYLRTNPAQGLEPRFARSAEVRLRQWETLGRIGAAQAELRGLKLETIAELGCEFFFGLQGDVKKVGDHAFSWLAGCLNGSAFVRWLDAKLAPPKSQTRTQTTPPPSVSLEEVKQQTAAWLGQQRAS